MSGIVFRPSKSNRGYVEAAFAPKSASRSGRWSLVDVAFALAMLACSIGLIWLVAGR